MGGVKDAIFGKPAKQKSKSGNHAWDAIEGAFTPALGYVTQAGGLMSSLLSGNTGALESFANSGGMQFLREQGERGITSSKAAQGLLKSGSYGTALAKYNQGLASTYMNQYLDNVFKLGQLGLGAGGTMVGAGSYSKGEGSGGKQGLGSMLAQGVGAAIGASDRRLKENIVDLGDGQYEFDYRQDTGLDLPEGRYRGYMADEVPEEFVVEMKDGFKGVKAPYLPERIN